MYIPALQARQAERGAVTRIAAKINGTGLCMPFFMPVTSKLNDVSLLTRQMSAAKVRHFILTTPLSTKYAKYSQSQILNLIETADENSCGIPTVSIGSKIDDATFRARVKAVKDGEFAIYHDSEATNVESVKSVFEGLRVAPGWHLFRGDTCTSGYMDSWEDTKRFVISDEFNRLPRNQDYAENDDEVYSNLIHDAYVDGFDGFGDFTITGDYFSPTGGRAGAVAIHFSYPRGKDGVWIRHFVSESTNREDDVAPKFIDATGQLLNYVAVSNADFTFSTALDELRRLHADGHFPGLPALKRISIQHHIELMIHLLGRKA